jgi:hypothetical protein
MQMKKMHLLLGGAYHDFEGFADAVRPLFEANGYAVDAIYDLTTLERLEEQEIDIVLMYTCFSGDAADRAPNVAQIEALLRWVRSGGGLLAVHGATVMPDVNAALRDLIGGAFVEHPPQFAFNVVPMVRAHPTTQGIRAFTVNDELYIQKITEDAQIHMVTVDRGVAYPMVWTREEGRGRVAYVAPGHGSEVWDQPTYGRLLRQAAAWLTDA